jgi:hypothetical protein
MLWSEILLISMTAVAAIALVLSIVALAIVGNKADESEVEQMMDESRAYSDENYEMKGAAGHVVKSLDTSQSSSVLPKSTELVVRPHSKFSFPSKRAESDNNKSTIVSFFTQVTEDWETSTGLDLFSVPGYGSVQTTGNLTKLKYVADGNGITEADSALTFGTGIELKAGNWYHLAFHITPPASVVTAGTEVCTVYVNGFKAASAQMSTKFKLVEGHIAPGRVVVGLPEGGSLAHLGVVYGATAEQVTTLLPHLKSNDSAKIGELKNITYDYLDRSDNPAIDLH